MAADPMYRQIAEDLRSKIEAGELARGTQLPTEIELRDQYDASRNTVRDAIKWLITRGLVETHPGQGTFVVEKITPFVSTLTGDPETGFGGGEDDIYDLEVKATRREPTASAPRVEIQQVNEVTAPELQIGQGSTVVPASAPVHRRHAVVTADLLLPDALRRRRRSPADRSHRHSPGHGELPAGDAGHRSGGWRDMIVVRAPNQVETTFFKLPDDGRVPVVETRRTTFDSRGMPVRLTVSVYPADRNQFAVNVGKVPDDIIAPQAGEDSAATGNSPT